jgi:outer membrane immunogenic protein
MRRLAALSIIFGIFAAVPSARAADLFELPLAPIWSGLYVGGHLGGVWDGDESLDLKKRCKDTDSCRCWWCNGDDGEWKKVDIKHFNKDDDDDDDVSFLGGLHIGYNWQEETLVYGLEADVSFADQTDYLASVRARLGFAMDNFLIYATIGGAFVGFDKDGHDGPLFEDDDDSKVGLVVGGGVEYKLDSNLSVGVEGLYYAFGDTSNILEWEKWCKEYKLTHKDDDDLFVVRARLSYHMTPAYEEPLK